MFCVAWGASGPDSTPAPPPTIFPSRDPVIETSMELGIKTLPSYQVRLGKKLLRECKTATEAGLSEMVRWACTRATGDVGGTLPVLKKSGGGCCSGGSCGPKSAKESTGKEGGGCCSNGSCGTKKATVRDHGHGHGHAAAAASAAAAPASSSTSDHRFVCLFVCLLDD